MRGSIYPWKDGWAAAVDTGKDIFGKRHRKVVYGKSHEEVESKLNTLLFEIQTGEYIKPAKDTLVDFMKEYHRICAGYDMWDEKATRPKKAKWELTTAELYKMYIDVHFKPYFKEMKLSDVKPKVLDAFYNFKLSQQTIKNKRVYKMSINTVRKLNTFLKSVFNYAIVNNQMKDNPTKHVILAKEEEFKPHIYEESQFISLLSEVSGTDDEIPIILGGGCGLRRGEIFGLYWKNIDLIGKTITVEKTDVRFATYTEKDPKNESSRRTISVPDYVITILKLYKVRSRNTKPNDKLVTAWKAGAYSEHFRKLLKKHELPTTRFHDLRHYNATIMMKYNVPDKVSAKRLGHANTTMLKKVYQHVTGGMDEMAANQINNTFTQKDSHQVSNI